MSFVGSPLLAMADEEAFEYQMKFKSAKNNCKGEYMRVDPENVDCGVDLQSVVKVNMIALAHLCKSTHLPDH